MSYSTHADLKQLHASIDELTSKISSLIFSGSGPNDLIPIIVLERNIVTASASKNFWVQITSLGTVVNKFNWSDTGAASGWTGQNIKIIDENQYLNHGIAIRFNDKTGHVVDDHWTFTLDAADSDDERAKAYNWINDRLRSHISVPVDDPTETLVLAEANFAVSLILRANGREQHGDFRTEAMRLITELLESPVKTEIPLPEILPQPTLAGA